MLKLRELRLWLTLSAVATFIMQSAYAWDGAASGMIENYSVVVGEPGNRESRIELSGFPTLCVGGSTWAYANNSDANYQALVAAIMSAKAQGISVVIYTNKDASNYFHIGYVVVS